MPQPESQPSAAALSASSDEKPLRIFVHYASQCLTDYMPHGDGLICFSLLNGLAQRGHKIVAYTNNAKIQQPHPNLRTLGEEHKSPADSLQGWEHALRANAHFKRLHRETPFDLVWRMHPYGESCPIPPYTAGLPLAIGPLFYSWPLPPGARRFRFKIVTISFPLAARGWRKTLRKADLIMSATEPQMSAMHAAYPRATPLVLPVIVDPPMLDRPELAERPTEVRLAFVANLVPNKNPRIFCETIKLLAEAGIPAHGTIIGDGPEKAELQKLIDLWKIGAAITFTGRLANAQVYEKVRQSTALVSASLGEPYGRNIVEAMSVGVPCICHASGGPRDIIQDGRNGLLVQDLTAAGYAAAATRLYRENGLQRTLAANAWEAALPWRPQAVLDQLEHALQNLCRKIPG